MKQELKALEAEHDALVAKEVNFDTLNPDLLTILLPRLGSVFTAVRGIAIHKASERHRSVLEVEWRHHWDTLLYRFYTTMEEPVSTRVL